MTEDEYMALPRQKYQELHQLKTQPTFYDYEKSFDQIWRDLGRQVLEKSLSQAPADRRKKKMTTRYGRIEIANIEAFSCHISGFGYRKNYFIWPKRGLIWKPAKRGKFVEFKNFSCSDLSSCQSLGAVH